MRFMIAIPTYNRPEMVLEAVDSVRKQNYDDWRILVSDNRSEIPAAQVLVERLKDPRIRVVLQPEHVSGIEHGRRICRLMLEEEFDYFSIMADDDYLASGALRHIASIPSPGAYIAGNIAYYYQKKRQIILPNPVQPEDRIRLNSLQSLAWNAYSAGVCLGGVSRGRDVDTPDTHVSFIFLKQILLHRMCEDFGNYQVDPFGDVGLGHMVKFEKEYDYIPRPIGLVRFFNNYGQIGKQDRRIILNNHTAVFEHSPLKHVSLANCAAESYFNVLTNLGYTNVRPTARLLLRHIQEIFHDRPKNMDTLRAFANAVSVILFGGYAQQTLKFVLERLFKKGPIAKPMEIIADYDDIARAAEVTVAFYNSNLGISEPSVSKQH